MGNCSRSSEVVEKAFFALRWIPPLLSLRWPDMRIVRIARDSATARYENAYRNLRRLALNIGDTQAEGAFHGLELRCHRARTNARVLDRLGSFCYGLFSDYGLSMARPIGWLILCWALVVGRRARRFGWSTVSAVAIQLGFGAYRVATTAQMHGKAA
jgi:hypothetical protein